MSTCYSLFLVVSKNGRLEKGIAGKWTIGWPERQVVHGVSEVRTGLSVRGMCVCEVSPECRIESSSWISPATLNVRVTHVSPCVVPIRWILRHYSLRSVTWRPEDLGGSRIRKETQWFPVKDEVFCRWYLIDSSSVAPGGGLDWVSETVTQV